MWNTLKAIKDEALATAKELRDAHNPEHWNNEEQNDDDHLYAFQAPASVPLAAAPLYSTFQPPPPAVATVAPPPPPPAFPVAVAAQPPAAAVPAPREDDVTSRLAALKAKLAAKTTAPRTNSTEPSPAPAASPTTTPAAPPAVVVDTSAITNLQRQLEDERRHHFAAQLEASRSEAAHHAAQCLSLQTALATAEARAVEAEEVARAHHGATAEEHERVIASLRAEIQAAQEEVISERSKAGVAASQVVELQERIERAEAAAENIGDHNELENELIAARMESSSLREELKRVRSQALNAAASAASLQTSSSLGNGGGGGGSETATAAELDAVRSELADIKQALTTAEADKNAARQQLSRLKTQMLSEQDDEEEKIKWRVEAEVKLALEKMGRASGNGANGSGSSDRTDEELHAALERAQRAEEEAARWEEIASARDAELANLQRALGEMSYESDAAERYRAELRAMQAEIHTLRNELDAARVSSLSAENKVQKAQNEVAAARGEAKVARDAEIEAKREVLAARVAAQEALKELQDLRKGGGTIDRSAVVQLIAGLMVQKRPKDALSFALHAINLSPEEVETIKTAARQSGSGNSVGGLSLASSWINFLESAVQEDGSTIVSADPLLPPPLAAAAAVPYSVPKPSTDPLAGASAVPPVTQRQI
ncbi:hypothetical protein NADE_004695 [Nannochloris sp. 'desiccata']|nr:hypothetical protein NADE_004695 [Chlorella desiccata (nom. nud.)]